MDDQTKPMADAPTDSTVTPTGTVQPGMPEPTASDATATPTDPTAPAGTATQMSCAQCGTTLDPNSEFCKACGAPTPAVTQPVQSPSQAVDELTPTPDTGSDTTGTNTSGQ